MGFFDQDLESYTRSINANIISGPASIDDARTPSIIADIPTPTGGGGFYDSYVEYTPVSIPSRPSSIPTAETPTSKGAQAFAQGKPISTPKASEVGSASSKASSDKSITQQIAERSVITPTPSGIRQIASGMREAQQVTINRGTDQEVTYTKHPGDVVIATTPTTPTEHYTGKRIKTAEDFVPVVPVLRSVNYPAAPGDDNDYMEQLSKSIKEGDSGEPADDNDYMEQLAKSIKEGGSGMPAAVDSDKSKEMTLHIQSATPDVPVTPEGFEAPAAPEGFEAPSAPTTPETPESFSVAPVDSNVISPSVERVISGKAEPTGYVKADGSAGQLSVSAYNSLGPDQQAYWKPKYDSNDVVAGLSKDTSLQEVLNAPSSLTTLSLNPVTTDRDYLYPDTEEQELDAYARELDKYNSGGIASGENALIMKYFGSLVPYIIQGHIQVNDLHNLAVEFESIYNGETSNKKYWSAKEGKYVSEKLSDPFDLLSYDDQKKAIQTLVMDGVSNNIPLPYSLTLVSALINSETENNRRDALERYVVNGGLEADLTAWGTGDVVQKFKNALTSDAGLTTIGVIFGAVSLGGAVLTGGLSAGLAASGLSGFLGTEYVSNFKYNPFLEKAKLQATGVYAGDREEEFEQKYNSVNKIVQALDTNKNTLPPESFNAEKERAYSALEELEMQLGDTFVYSKYLGLWDTDKSRVKALHDTLDRISGQFTEEGVKITGAQDKPAEISLTIPRGYYAIIYDPEIGEQRVNEGGWNRQLKGSGQVAYELYDKDGNKVGASGITYYPNTVWKGTAVPKTAYTTDKSDVKSTTYTITVPLGAVMAYAGKSYVGGKSYDIVATEGMSNNVVISQPGRKDEEKTLYPQDVAWVSWRPVLQEDPYYDQPGQKTYGQIDLQTSPDTTVTINGKQFSPQGNKTIVPVVSGYYSVKVSRPGYEDWEKTIYVGDGQTVAVSDPSVTEKEETKKTYSSGGYGGGGGGGSSGGSSSKVTWGLIKYGNACVGAEIWQDETRVYPVIETEYSIDPGYHAIVIKKTGKKDWLKTVYIAAGDTVTVSPAFEDADSTSGSGGSGSGITSTDETKRVYVNSEPYNAKVLVNGGYTGEWTPCYLDLPKGYYIISIVKSGYIQQDIPLYVGDIILWEDAARNRASEERLI